MAISDSLAMSSPYGRAPITKQGEWLARVLERGNSVAPCPKCGADSELEPPLSCLRGSQRGRATVHRCRTCGPIWGEFEALPEIREELTLVSKIPPLCPPLCECGCGEPVTRNACKPDAWNRYAGPKCSKRVWNAKRATVKPPVIVEPASTTRDLLVDMAGNHTVTLPTAALAPASLLCVVKTYLHGLNPEGRQALLDLVAAEEYAARLAKRAHELGVV